MNCLFFSILAGESTLTYELVCLSFEYRDYKTIEMRAYVYCLPIEFSWVHISLLSYSGDEEPQGNHEEDSFIQSLRDHVPHLVVERMQFLESLEIVQFWWSVSNCPHSQVMHMSKHAPVMTEGDLHARRLKFVRVWSLLVVSAESAVVSESLFSSLEVLRFIHFYNYN